MLTDFTNSAFEYVCINMREVDKREIMGIRPHDSPLQLAAEVTYFLRNKGFSTIAWSDRTMRPAGFAALTENWPGCWEVWMGGTDDFKDVAIEMIRWVRKTAAHVLTYCEGRRLQCDSRFDHDEAHKMLRAFGAVEEVTLRKYGKDGADYIRFVWFNGENDAVLRPHFKRAA